MFAALARVYRAVILKHPALALPVVVITTVAAALGLPHFKLDASADSLTLENDRSLDFFREINQRYRTADFLVVTYTPHDEMFSDRSLATLKALQDELAQVQGVQSINSILTVPLLYSPMRSLAEQQQSTRTLLTEGVDRELAREEFLRSPIYRDTLLSEDSRTTALQLNLAVDDHYYDLVGERDQLRLKARDEGLSEAEQARLDEVSQEFRDYRTEATARDHARVEQVRTILTHYDDRAELFLGGVSMITSDMIAFIQSDLVVFGTAILLFVIGVLAVIFRQWRFVLLPLATCLLTVVIVLGWLSWIDWRLTVISSNFVALLLIMTLALTIYLVVRYRETHRRHPQWSQEDLVADTTRAMVLPCLYTVLTTMVAFMSLVVSDIRPVIDFGWMMTIGLSVAFVLAFVIIPCGLMLLPKGEPKDKGDQSAAVTLKFSYVAEHHGGKVVIIALVAAMISAYGLTKLEVDNRFIDYFQEDTEIYQGMSVIDRQLGGTINLDIVLEAPAHAKDSGAELEDDPFADPDDDPFADDPFASPDEGAPGTEPSYWFTRAGLQEIQALHRYLDSLPEVGKVQSLSIAYDVARDIAGSALNDFELAVMRRSLPDDITAVLIDPHLSDEHQQTRISLRVKETSPHLRRMELVDKIHTYASTELGFEPEQVRFTGMLVLYNNMLLSLFNSQIATIGAVFLGIRAMFLVLFRSLRVAIIAILPNMLAASVVLGGMGLAGIPLDMMTITIAAITVGVGVDHAIHYLYRFRREFADRRHYIESMHASHASIGRAMFYTAIIIIVGFSTLALSEFNPSIHFGLLTAVAMFTAIVGSLTLLPKLVLIAKPFGKELNEMDEG